MNKEKIPHLGKYEDLAKQIKPILFDLTPKGIKEAKQKLKEHYKNKE